MQEQFIKILLDMPNSQQELIKYKRFLRPGVDALERVKGKGPRREYKTETSALFAGADAGGLEPKDQAFSQHHVLSTVEQVAA